MGLEGGNLFFAAVRIAKHVYFSVEVYKSKNGERFVCLFVVSAPLYHLLSAA
jgi:hypothetical protein